MLHNETSLHLIGLVFYAFLSDIYTNEKLNVGIFRNFKSRDTGLGRTGSEPTKDDTITLREWNHVYGNKTIVTATFHILTHGNRVWLINYPGISHRP